MALAGRRPKLDENGNSTAVTRNKRKHWAGETYDAPGEPLGPALPDDGVEWCAATLRWWETLRRHATVVDLLASDWEALYLAARLHHRLCSDPKVTASQAAALSKEISRHLGSIGWTLEDRRRLGIKVKTPGSDDRPTMPQRRGNIAEDYRRRLDPNYSDDAETRIRARLGEPKGGDAA